VQGWSWKLDAPTLGIAFLIMGDAAAFWSANNPSVFTVRAFRRKGGDEARQTARDIRIGGLAGTGLAVAVGFGGSLVTKSYWPLTAAIGVIAFQWALWEWAIAHPHGNATDIASQSLE
jgi:hypothetical protein